MPIFLTESYTVLSLYSLFPSKCSTHIFPFKTIFEMLCLGIYLLGNDCLQSKPPRPIHSGLQENTISAMQPDSKISYVST